MDLLRPELCDACAEAAEREYEKELQIREAEEVAEKIRVANLIAARSLDAATPERYRMTDVNHREFNHGIWERVKDWQPTSETPWLGLIGESDGSKTRIAYLLLRKIVLNSIDESGRRAMSFAAATTCALSAAVRDQYSKRGSYDNLTVGDHARDFLDNVAECSILLLDDLGKVKHTPAVSAELFAIIDWRHAENLPMIWTANGPPIDIVAGMADDMSGPLAGRLIECSQIIKV